jgi:hypothetical protein
MGTNDEDWPEIELYPARKGILSKFTTFVIKNSIKRLIFIYKLVLQVKL